MQCVKSKNYGVAFLKYLNTVVLIALLLGSTSYSQSKPDQKKEKSLALSVSGNLPTGPWRNRSSFGVGAHIKYEVNISSTVSWFLQAGYLHYWGKESSFGTTKYTTYFDTGEFGTGIKIHSKKNYFGLLGLSVNTFARKALVVQNISGWNQETRTNNQVEKFGVMMGGGYIYPLTGQLDLEGTAVFNYLGDEGSDLGLMAGLKIKFY